MLHDLIDRARHGDQQAINTLLDHVRPYLKSMAGQDLPQKIQRRLDASDIAQDTLLDLFHGIGAFLGRTDAEFIAWIQQALGNRLIDEMRRHIGARRRSADYEDSRPDGKHGSPAREPTAATSTPSRIAVRNETLEALHKALGELPEPERVAIQCRYFQGMSVTEIARQQGVERETVSRRISRGLEKLGGLVPDEA